MRFSWCIAVLLLIIFSCQKDTPIIQEENVNIFENSPGITDMELEAVTLINEFRAAGAVCGSEIYSPAPEVYWNNVLDQASEMHADDMFSNGFISHTGSNGSKHTERLQAVNYEYMYAGENVAKGPTTVAVVIEEFKNSPSHCAVMMNPDYVHVGVAKIGKYWVLNFAHPRRF